MTRLISFASAAAAVLALVACNEPRPEETETAAAFPGADVVADRSAPAMGTEPPAGTAPEGEAPPLNPPPTLPPEDDATSPAAGVTSPPER